MAQGNPPDTEHPESVRNVCSGTISVYQQTERRRFNPPFITRVFGGRVEQGVCENCEKELAPAGGGINLSSECLVSVPERGNLNLHHGTFRAL